MRKLEPIKGTAKYRFVGDPDEYTWEPKPVVGQTYNPSDELNGFMSIQDTIGMAFDQDENDPFLKDWELVWE